MKKKIIISCDEATSICDKSQYGEASLFEKFKLSFHFMLCKNCRTYSAQNTYISKLLGKHFDHSCTSVHLNENDKQYLKKKVEMKLKKEES